MDELRLFGKQTIRLQVLARVTCRELTVVAASEVMGLSLRQSRRLWKRLSGNRTGSWCSDCANAPATGG